MTVSLGKSEELLSTRASVISTGELFSNGCNIAVSLLLLVVAATVQTTILVHVWSSNSGQLPRTPVCSAPEPFP